MSATFQHLFTPLKIGPITVRNRILSSGHTTGYPENNLPNAERMAYYHAERAKGGVGLIILEGTAVHPTSTAFGSKLIWTFDERSIPGLSLIADVVHQYGAKIFSEIFHVGISNTGMDSRLPVWGPSDIPDPAYREIPHQMEIEEIKENIEGYGKAAENIKKAGFDGVEVHAAHSYQLHQFLSPLFNKRTDEYGGSLENRMRFLLEVIDRVREKIGYGLALGVRMTGDDLTTGGLTLDDTKTVAKGLEATGKVNYLSVSVGNPFTKVLQIAPMYVPPGHIVYMAAAIKEVVNIPVFTVGRITDPVLAESILAEGKADMVAMTRALIADPELPNKALEGRLDDIRACIGCMQACAARFSALRGIGCVQNPAVGREREWGVGTLKLADRVKRVLVVGGGPAGMEAARVAALRGHDVILYEREKELGGQVNLAAKLPGREEVGSVARWLEIQIKKLGVKVVIEKEVTPEVVEELKPDAVVVATGAKYVKMGFTGFLPGLPFIPGSEQENVVTPEQILRREVKAGKKVVILDEDGFIVPLGLAELLASEGSEVEILSRMLYIGMDVDAISLAMMYSRNFKHGVKLTPLTYIKEISGNTVVAYHIYTKEERRIEGVDTVVLATCRKANDELYKRFKGKVSELYAVGDCIAPRKMDMAIYEGHKIGTML